MIYKYFETTLCCLEVSKLFGVLRPVNQYSCGLEVSKSFGVLHPVNHYSCDVEDCTAKWLTKPGSPDELTTEFQSPDESTND